MPRGARTIAACQSSLSQLTTPALKNRGHHWLQPKLTPARLTGLPSAPTMRLPAACSRPWVLTTPGTTGAAGTDDDDEVAEQAETSATTTRESNRLGRMGSVLVIRRCPIG